jgi:hypothetical protein
MIRALPVQLPPTTKSRVSKPGLCSPHNFRSVELLPHTINSVCQLIFVKTGTLLHENYYAVKSRLKFFKA